MNMLSDVSGINGFSRYFNQTRADYIIRRTRLIAMILMLVQPLWLVVDYWLLSSSAFGYMVYLRIGSAALCGFLVFLKTPQQISNAHKRLFSLIAILLAFQYFSTQNLIYNGYNADMAGYQFFTFMIVSTMAIFPLSIIEISLYTLLVFIVQIASQYAQSTLGSIDSINTLWLLSVLALISGWAGINQLSMLMTLFRQATHDPLTHLANRRQAMKYLNAEIKRSRHKHAPLSLIFLDLDHFKRFNDNYGHAAGDLVLKAFAKLLKEQTRDNVDLVARYGGEEFLCALSDCDLASAAKVAENIRQACHESDIQSTEGVLSFRSSIGVAELGAKDNIESWINRADEALYKAKEQGRDQVVCAPND